jgi:hypothetical protein
VVEPIYYEDLYDAIDRQINASGLQRKEIAAEIFKGRSIETAKSLLSRSLDPNNTDCSLSITRLIAILDITGAEHIINMLCDRYFFDRPAKKSRNGVRRDLETKMDDLMRQFTSMQRSISKLEGE